MLLAFDLDETLVATRDANIWAYERVGVRPPSNFHLVPWQNWISDEVHARKQKFLPEGLSRHGRLLPASRILLASGADANSEMSTIRVIVTRASKESLEAIRGAYPHLFRSVTRIFFALTDQQRLNVLQRLYPEMTGLYFDDDESTCDDVARLSDRWRSICTAGWSAS